MSDWMEAYLAGGLAVDEFRTPEPVTTDDGSVEADPVGVVGAVMQHLAGRGVPMVVDGGLDRAVEVAGRLLRCLGVEAADGYRVAS